MGFSVKITPGIRVRASSRGVRTSLGPRVARVHVGGGRTGVSTGVGPFGYYTSLGGSRRSTSTGSVNRQIAAAARQRALADKAAEANRLQQAFNSIAALHREEFRPAARPTTPPPPEPPVQQLRDLYRSQARRGTSFFDFAARREALRAADERADAAATIARTELARQASELQRQLDASWAALRRCEPDVTLEVLNAAFADNQAAASAVGIEGTEASLLVVVPPVTDIPERKPTLTAAGNLSLKKLTKTEAADVYKQLVCGHLVVTLKEAFAVAPGVVSARIVAVRASAPDAYGNVNPEVLAAVRCSRSDLAEVRWAGADAVQVVNDCCTEKILVQKGATRALQPVRLDEHPDLQALVAAIDIAEVG
jgi:hypothetical protein